MGAAVWVQGTGGEGEGVLSLDLAARRPTVLQLRNERANKFASGVGREESAVGEEWQ